MYDLKDKTFGKLLVLYKDERSGGAGNELRWVCLCSCGEITSIRSYCLRKGGQKSCGCDNGFKTNNQTAKKHGLHNTRTYHSWEQMKQRTSNPNYPNYKYYGARGISVCDRWKDFEKFLVDMGERPQNTSIDRIDVHGNYEPGNCRWATPTEQANNKQHSRKELPIHADSM